MKKLIRGVLFSIIVSTCAVNCTSVKKYSSANAHSHNDYLNSQPFINAYNEGFGSIEADVFPIDGVLLVAHNKKDVQKQNTLQALYLDPLVAALRADNKRKLNLLIDVKENHAEALNLLQKELQPLMEYLSTAEKKKNITISISGERPVPDEYSKYPGYISFDDDLKLKHTPEQWKRVSLVSLQFDKITDWKGNDPILPADYTRLKQIVDSVHTARKPIRFWAAPDTEEAWKQQMKLHVDFIGTDKINELASFLRGKNKRAL
ncbi:MAG: alkaline phosphatase [Bacteroidota bacterium]|nr:alkaline phosphatase [Bacteroidota bacterium]